MLSILLAWHLVFMSTPHVTPVVSGQYTEVVRVDYDAINNITYGTVARYSVDDGRIANVNWMQSRAFPTGTSKSEMVKTIVSDKGIQSVD